jgi:putative spermidine/putrescine transport system ATP-binding protein
MFLRSRQVSHSFGSEQVLKEVSFDISAGQFVSIVGPSGAGKTTLLKIIAGLEQPESGRVEINAARDLRRHPPILVFQDYMLFPYMSVFDNVAFGLRARRMSAAEVRRRVDEMLAFFRIGEKAGEYPARLSGGQQQRVALARALVIQPELLLLDEPYANLDRNLKMDTAAFLRHTQQRFGITTICVTHDIEEALAVSDSLGILIDGRIQDFGPPERVYRRPATLAGGTFLGDLHEIKSHLYPRVGLDEQAPCVYVRAEAVDVKADSRGAGEVRAVRFLGDAYRYDIGLNGTSLTAHTVTEGLNPGDRVRIRLREYLRPVSFGPGEGPVLMGTSGSEHTGTAMTGALKYQGGLSCG